MQSRWCCRMLWVSKSEKQVEKKKRSDGRPRLMRQRDKTWFYSRPPFTHAHSVTRLGGWQAVGERAACWAAEGPASWADNVAAGLRTRK